MHRGPKLDDCHIFFLFQFKSKATLCRAASNECDLPEYCHGDTEWCPSDTHKQNGLYCDQEQVRNFHFCLWMRVRGWDLNLAAISTTGIFLSRSGEFTTVTSLHALQAFCYDGRCRTRETQCRKLWGSSGRDGNALCYTHFNVMGKAHGNCGFQWSDKSFLACDQE